MRGRPVKKPGYDREAEIQALIGKAAELAVEPFEEERDTALPTLTEIADAMNTTILRVRKLLITAGYYTSPTAQTVQLLKHQGKSIEEIMMITGLGKASVYSYLPYTKGAYNLSDPTLFSEQGKRYRRRCAAVRALENHRDKPDVLFYLWKAVIAFQEYSFTTSGRGSRPGVKFSYQVSAPGGKGGRRYSGSESVDGFGNELFLIVDGVRKEKSISRSTVDLSYRRAVDLMNAEGEIRGPKKLGIPGAGSYLYSMLIRFGVIRPDSGTVYL